MDDNTVVLLDFGKRRVRSRHGCLGWDADASTIFAAGCSFGTRGEIRGLLLNGEPFDFPRRE